MAKLGDLFSNEWKEQLANENLKTGGVIRITVPDTVPPKLKLLIIVGFDHERVHLASIFINSDINPNVFNTPELQALQYPIISENNPFLSHNSFADCSKIASRDFSGVFNLIKDNPGCHIGQLNEDDFKKIKDIIKGTRTISIRLKKQFGIF